MEKEEQHIPKLTGKDEIKLQKKTVYTLSCPKCDIGMDVTSVNPNTYIECQKCQNVTWRPDYNPPWWAKTRAFIGSLLFTLIIGIVTGIISNIIYSKMQNRNNIETSSTITQDSINIQK